MDPITGIVVCVDYADHLSRSLSDWVRSLDRVCVVTAPRDTATKELCDRHGVMRYETDVFWERGAKFNKGAAIAQAFDHLALTEGWCLFFDADVAPPPALRATLETAALTPGTLYGAGRMLESGKVLGDAELAGFFQLAHVTDPHMAIRPVVDVDWAHAGNYDTTFQLRWPAPQRVRLPLLLTHFGEPHVNWCGRGNADGMRELQDERRKRGGSYQHEKVRKPR